MTKQTTGVYIHIPFCAAKCPYCDFYSMPPTPQLLQDYYAALCRCIAALPQGLAVDSIYFGGGTPSLMPPHLLADLLGRLAPLPGCEISLEANPGTVDADLLHRLRGAGFNRISLGLQSAVASELQALGRRHTPEEAAQAVALARQAGFETISLDVMLGIPGQTLVSALQTIEFCRQLAPEHISAYLLKIEPATPFGRCPPALPQDDDQAELYLAVCNALAQASYEQYEISNFAQPGFACRHNLKYWRCLPTIGLGPAAHSFYNGKRSFFPRDIDAFIAALNPLALAQPDGSGGGLEERLLLGLRLAEGVPLSELAAHRGCDQPTLYRRLLRLQQAGLLVCGEERVHLTSKGFLVSNSILGELLA